MSKEQFDKYLLVDNCFVKQINDTMIENLIEQTERKYTVKDFTSKLYQLKN